MPNPVKMTRPENAKPPFQFLNIDNASEPARVNIYDIIGETWWDDGITGKSFVSELSALGTKRDIDVYISSNGGDVKDGTVIYNALLHHQGTVRVIIDGWAISIASVIAMVGDTVEMGSIGMMMIHKPLNWCFGNANDMRKNAETLDKVEGALSNSYINKTGLSAEDIGAMLDAETWMTAEDALAKGFIDSIIEEPGLAITNSFNADNMASYANVPETVLAALAEQEDESGSEEEPEEIPEDVDDPVDDPENPADIENARVMEIMNQCQALGLEHMQMGLIKDKTSIANAKTILLNVKAGIDDSSSIQSQHRSEITTKTSMADSWDAAMKKVK